MTIELFSVERPVTAGCARWLESSEDPGETSFAPAFSRAVESG